VDLGDGGGEDQGKPAALTPAAGIRFPEDPPEQSPGLLQRWIQVFTAQPHLRWQDVQGVFVPSLVDDPVEEIDEVRAGKAARPPALVPGKGGFRDGDIREGDPAPVVQNGPGTLVAVDPGGEIRSVVEIVADIEDHQDEIGVVGKDPGREEEIFLGGTEAVDAEIEDLRRPRAGRLQDGGEHLCVLDTQAGREGIADHRDPFCSGGLGKRAFPIPKTRGIDGDGMLIFMFGNEEARLSRDELPAQGIVIGEKDLLFRPSPDLGMEIPHQDLSQGETDQDRSGKKEDVDGERLPPEEEQ